MEGTPEEVAEKLVKEEGGEELKQRELQKKGAHQIPGVAGSGIERGEAAAVAQVSATLHAVGGSHRSMGLDFLKRVAPFVFCLMPHCT